MTKIERQASVCRPCGPKFFSSAGRASNRVRRGYDDAKWIPGHAERLRTDRKAETLISPSLLRLGDLQRGTVNQRYQIDPPVGGAGARGE